MALQTLVVQALGAQSESQPTMLIDALLGGTGPQLVRWVLSSQYAQAQQRATLLGHLMGVMPGVKPVVDEESVPPPVVQEEAA